MVRFFAILGMLVLLSARALAVPVAVELSDADLADIQRIENYLNGIKTMTADFLQVDAQGITSEGKLYIARPNHMRFEYTPPSPITIVTNGTWLTYYDSQLKQVSNVPLSDTPLYFLVKPNMRLSGDVTVTRLQRSPGALRVTLTQTKTPEAGNITLVFSEAPFLLRQWQVIDPQGLETRVSLSDPRFDVAIPSKMFDAPGPERPAFPQ